MTLINLMRKRINDIAVIFSKFFNYKSLYILSKKTTLLKFFIKDDVTDKSIECYKTEYRENMS